MKRIHVYYSGRVQGVGFRFTARNIASELNLTGWVKNLFDGRVEIVCEGEKDKLEKFLTKIKNSMLDKYITNETVSWMSGSGEFNEFKIEYF